MERVQSVLFVLEQRMRQIDTCLRADARFSPALHRTLLVGIGRVILSCALSLAVCFAVWPLFLPASGQTLTTGHVAEILADTQGRMIANARIAATNEETRAVIITKSTGNGTYHLSWLVPGQYRANASPPGPRCSTRNTAISPPPSLRSRSSPSPTPEMTLSSPGSSPPDPW